MQGKENSFTSSFNLSILPIINSIPKSTLETITGNMLGDGSMPRRLGKYIVNSAGKYTMTMDTYSIHYLQYLNVNIYSSITNIKIYPYPKCVFTSSLSIFPPNPLCFLFLFFYFFFLMSFFPNIFFFVFFPNFKI